MVHLYWTPRICTKLTHLTQKLKYLDETYDTKLDSNRNSI